MFNQDELEKIKQKALEEHIPILMDDTLEKIEEILKQEKPKRILEIGTAVGYSASMFAKFTDNDCIIDTIEISEERAEEAKQNVQKIGVAERINIMVGNAVDILPTLNETYDIVFIDAAKGQYLVYLEEAIRLTKIGGIIIADNMLYRGRTLSDYNEHKHRTATNRLREYLSVMKEDERLDSTLVKIGDGLAISIVK